MSNGINAVGTNYNYQQLSTMKPQKESGWSKFGKVLGGVAGSLPMLGGVFGALGVGGGSSAAAMGGGMTSSFNQQYELIMLQQQIQQQTQMFSTMSNISKSKHESSMAAVRNMK